MDLNTIWFVLLGVLFAGYAVLDGFDLGVGILHLFARSREERDVGVASIGPVWDGNEVWLITGGGALFAAFPVVYATIFSGFYLALMLVLLALIARAVSLEFRGLVESARWQRVWDWAFGLGSLVPAILFGVAVGNVLRGVPITQRQEWAGSFLGLLNPYSILVGLVSASFFVMHGALWLRLKSEGALAERMKKVALGAWGVFVALYGVATFATVAISPFLFQKTREPLFWLLTALIVASAATVPLALRAGRDRLAFVGSAATIVCAILVTALSAFPVLVPSSIDPAYSLTAYDSSSSPRTLTVMLVIALVGMPLVIGYTAFIYTLFRGKVRVGAAYGEAKEPEEIAGAA
ncbi:MAG TPA: cytochrome d ubiquinol oxidase subunit II [Anaeromyxobacteraceae bacterium]|nr:cytochrome d ubiquinol oxidase subunit II [Anaeromyxobacteraceae bacterium]